MAADNTEYESVLQFTGDFGEWNDLPGGPSLPVGWDAHVLDVYVKETNLAASPLTITSGDGTVTFSGAVGTSKALASLNVTADTIAINGGAVTTEGLQTYTGDVTLGAAATTLTQTDAAMDFTLQASKSITNAYGNDASLTVKTTGSIILDTDSSIESSTGALEAVLWADSDDATNGRIQLNSGAGIVTNGGDLWMGGSDTAGGSTDWNGLTVGDGYAKGTADGGNEDHVLRSGISFTSASVDTNGGEIYFAGQAYGASANTGYPVPGIFMSSTTIDGGAGDITLYGLADGASASNFQGLTIDTSTIKNSGSITIIGDGERLGINMYGTSLVQSASTDVLDQILIRGTTPATSAYGFSINASSVLSSVAPIEIESIGVSGFGLRMINSSYIGYKSGTDITSSTSNITVITDKFFEATQYFQSSGILTFKPYTDTTTIGIAGGTGTLSLPAVYFSTNFTAGFSKIIVGSATAGDISIGGAVSYSDPLTLKTAGNILTTAAAAGFTGAVAGADTLDSNLIFWADADNGGNGYIRIYDGNTITTNGGNIVMAGGLDNGDNSGTAGDGIPDGYAMSDTNAASGVGIGRINNGASAATTLQSGGGDITIRGKSTGTSPSMGIHFAHSGTLNAGAGTLTMLGEAASYHGIELSAWVGGMLNISANTVNIQGKTSAADFYGLAASELAEKYTSITADAGGITLYGEHTGAGTGGIQQALDLTTTNGGDIVIESPDTFWFYNAHNAHSYSAGTGDITVRVNGITNSGSAGTTSFTGSNSLTIEPYTTRAINIGTTGTGTLDIASSYFNTNFTNGFSGITVGDATAGAITVGAATTFNDSVTLLNNSTIAINGAVTANENLTLTGAGAITQSAALDVTGTTSITAGAANDITLINTSNDFTGAVTVVSGNDIDLVDSNAMTLGAVNSTGTVDAATLTGDLTLTGAIATTDTGDSAIILNAGKSTAAGTSTGGNIMVSGGTLSTGSGGRATLYSGDISDSTGLTALIVSGSGNFRYNSDEGTSDFSTTLSSGKYAVYREQPTLTVTAADDQIYTGVTYSGGNGVGVSGLQNGDTSAMALSGSVSYGGTSQGAAAVGTYPITPSGYTSLLGYALNYANGTLTIAAAVGQADIDTVVRSLTSLQQAVNGTQETSSGNSGATSGDPLPGGYAMGPGSGSSSIDMFSVFKLIEDRTQQTFPDMDNFDGEE